MEFGCTRMVFLVGRWAIKFPTRSDINHFLLGVIHNRNESQRFKSFKEPDPRLARVIWMAPLGLILIMERLRPMVGDGLTHDAWKRHGRYLRAIFSDLWCVKDIKPDNFGWRSDGTLACFDYGDL